MMKWEMFPVLSPFSTVWNTQLKQLATELENFCGRSKDVQMESGLALTPTSYEQSEHSTSTKYTLGPNTTMTLTTQSHPQYNETCFSITTRTTLPTKTTPGTTSETDSMSSQQSISHIAQAKDRTAPVSSLLESTGTGTTTSSTSTGSKRTKSRTTSKGS